MRVTGKRLNEPAIMRKKAIAVYQPYPKGTVAHDLFRIINEQGLPDSTLGEMCGLGRATICNWRVRARRPVDLEAIEKVVRRCGYRIAFVPDDEPEAA